MAWTNPRTWVSTEVVTASQMNTHVRDNFNETAPAKASTISGYMVVNGTNSINQRVPQFTQTTAGETTASTSYTDLATTGPQISSITTGSSAICAVGCEMSNDTGGARGFMGVAVSGSSTISPNDNRAFIYESGSAGDLIQATYTFIIESLTAGTNTFTAKYRVSGGTGTFADRSLTILPL